MPDPTLADPAAADGAAADGVPPDGATHGALVDPPVAGASVGDLAGVPGFARFIGNATLLIRFGPLTILTDPNFVHRDAEVPLGFGLTATRLTDPAVDAEEIPAPDVVILSHDHGDHFDAVAADWLDPDVPIVTCPGAVAALEEKGFRAVRALETWEATELEKEGVRLRITAVPAQHAPGALVAALLEVTGTILELSGLAQHEPAASGRRGARRSKRGRGGDQAHDGQGSRREHEEPQLRLYVSGDTVLTDDLAEIRDRFPQIDVAFIHLGGMRVMGMTLTLDAYQGVQLIELLSPRMTIPIHYNDYGTSKSSLAEFVAAVNEAGLADRVRYLRHGDAWPLLPRPVADR